VDIILAPTTPCVAPRIDQETMVIGGEEILVRPNLGLFTQPLSFIGLPVLSVPVKSSSSLPLGVQIIAWDCLPNLYLLLDYLFYRFRLNRLVLYP